MRNLFFISMILFSAFTVNAQQTEIKQKTKAITSHVDISINAETQLPDTVQTDNKSESFYYDKNGNMILNAKYEIIDGKPVRTDGDIVCTYDEQNRLITDSTTNTKQFYGYDANGKVLYKAVYQYYNNNKTFKDSTIYNYDQQGRVESEYIFVGNGVKKSENYYYYGTNGKLLKIEYKDQASATTYRLTKRADYLYDSADRLIEETVVRISGSSEVPYSKHRWAYDELDRVAVDTIYKSGKDAAGNRIFILSTQNKYKYEGNSQNVITMEQYTYNTISNEFLISDVVNYQNSFYATHRTPKNFTINTEEGTTNLIFTVVRPSFTYSFEGYKVMIDNEVADTVYTSDTFTLLNQVKGTHTYRVMAVFDGFTANCSDGQQRTIKIALPSPKNISVISKEYNLSWKVKFKWDAPVAQEELHLIGYRWTVEGGNGVVNGNNTDPSLTNAVFTFYGMGMGKISLYAVYEEGESEATVYDVALNDVADQITVHWQNQSGTTRDNSGNITKVSRFYYNSGTFGEQITLRTDYDNNGEPISKTSYAFIKNSFNPENEKYDLWDKTAKVWNPVTRTDYLYKKSGVKYGKMRSLYNAETKKYVKEAVEYYTYDENVSLSEPATTTVYECKANGDSTCVAYIKHAYITNEASAGYTQSDTVYASDAYDAAIKQYVETVFAQRNVMKSETIFDYNGTAFAPKSRTIREYSEDTELCTKESVEEYASDVWNNISTTLFTPSKEYHTTHMATELYYKNNVFTWKEPQRAAGLSGYKILVNGVEYVTTEATSYDVEGLKTGKYIFNIVPMFDGNDGTISADLTVNYSKVEQITFDNIKEMTQATPNTINIYSVAGEIMVTGVFTEADRTNVFAEDATAGILISMNTETAMPFKKGEKIKNLTGKLIDKGNGLYFEPTGKETVSTDNVVQPTVITLQTFNEDRDFYHARFVHLDNVTFDESFKQTIDGKEYFTPEVVLKQGELMLDGKFTSESPVLYAQTANIEGHICNQSTDFVMYIESVETVTDINNPTKDRTIIFDNATIYAAEASHIEVYDVTGRMLLSQQGTTATLSQHCGVVIVKVSYPDGSNKLLKYCIK